MSRPTVKGAGETDMRENPPVHSKGMTFHGKPHAPGSVSHPGATVPLTGNTVKGFTEHGHMKPRDATPTKGGHQVHRLPAETLGHSMADGHRSGGKPNTAQTDALDRKGYTGGKYPGDK